MKIFQPEVTDDEVLTEVWKIKDETVKRYRTADDYVKALHSKIQTPNRAVHGTSQKPRARDLGSKEILTNGYDVG